jgi:hypothetical protein
LGARYDLTEVHAAARGGAIELDERRARDEVLLYLASFVDAYPLAAELLLALTSDDFVETVTLEPPHAGAYDVYALALPAAVGARHGVPACGWYLKLQLREGLFGESVFLVSMHPLERGIQRVGGWLPAKGTS